jgi:hypothetical protein
MRVLGLVLAGVLALTAAIGLQASPLGSKIERGDAGPAPGIVQVWGGSGPNWHPAPTGWRSGWNQGPHHSRQWSGGWVSRQWVPNGPLGGWVCCPGPGVPTYWVWGPSGGAFDYPFSDWRGPTGGWGNP